MIPKKRGEIAFLLGFFLFALLLRMYAFNYLPLRPVTDDAYEYNYIAHNLARAIKGEQLEDRNKFLYLGSKRGWLYPLFITGIYKFFGPRVLNVRLFQIIIDSLTCLLIYLIARDIFNKKVGASAALLASFYPGFIYYSTMLYQETTTIFLLTLNVLLLCRAISQKRLLLYFISGILTTIISFYRSGFILFPLLIIPLLFLTLWFFYKRNFLFPLLYFLVGALCMFILYGAFSYWVSGSFNFNKPSIAWSIYETTHRDGWLSDTFAPTPTNELNEVAQEYGYSIPPDSHALRFPPKIYLMATTRHILNNPSGYLSQLIKRCKRMWTYIETYPGKWHSKRVRAQLIFHRLLVLLALVGIPLSLTVWHQSWLLFSILLYVTIAYIPTIGIPRYAVPAMPFIIILATHAVLFIATILKDEKKLSLSFKLFSYFAVILAAIVCYLDVPTLMKLFPHASPFFLYNITALLMNFLFIVAACWLYRVFYSKFRSANRAFYTVVFPLATVILLYNNSALTSKTWHEWEAPLFSDHQKVRQTIVLPDNLNPENFKEAHLMIDMFGGGGQDYNFQVKVNGKEIKVYQRGIKAKENKFDNKFFGLYKSFFFDTYKLSPEDLRQWYEIELPLHFLENNSLLVIECSLSETVDHERNYVIVFGDYATSKEENIFEGPCFPRSDLDTSLVKIMPYSGDYRFERITTLSSKKTISEYYNGLEWTHNDLSPRRGIQSGNYRIRIELIGKDGSQVIF